MTKEQALELIDEERENTVDPVKLLNFVWLRVIIKQIPDHEWRNYVSKAEKILSR